jgi:DNA-binding MarR family transcriptional regulator
MLTKHLLSFSRRGIVVAGHTSPVVSDSASIRTVSAIRAAAFRSALRSFLRASEEISRANGLTPQRHLLLLMIKGAPDGSERATVGELVDRLELAQSTVTELVQRAEEAGLVARETSDLDGRVAYLRLTAEGERRLAKVFRSHADERRRLVKMLNDLEGDGRGGGVDDVSPDSSQGIS